MIIILDTDITHLTTFRIPVKCGALVTLRDSDEIGAALSDDRLPKPFKQIGEGSNLLFTKDFPGTIIISEGKSYRIYPADCSRDEATATEFFVEAESGLSLDALCEALAEEGLWGLENLSGIPGTVGAAPVQNVGAYGVEAKDVIHKVNVFDNLSGYFVWMENEYLDFGYRHSIFKESANRDRYYVTRVVFKVTRKPSPRLGYAGLEERARKYAAGGEITPMSVRLAVLETRAGKLPDVGEYGSAGSFFKNPVIDTTECHKLLERYPDMPNYPLENGKSKLSAAWLIDRAGGKKLRVGDAAVWPKQPLIIYNAGHATATDVIALETRIIESVKETFNIELTPEVEHI